MFSSNNKSVLSTLKQLDSIHLSHNDEIIPEDLEFEHEENKGTKNQVDKDSVGFKRRKASTSAGQNQNQNLRYSKDRPAKQTY